MKPNKCKCGEIPTIAHISDYMWGHTLGYYVVCENCGRSSQIMSTEDETIIAWNEEEN